MVADDDDSTGTAAVGYIYVPWEWLESLGLLKFWFNVFA